MRVNKQSVFILLLTLIMLLSITGPGYGKSIQGMELHEGLDDLTRQLTKGLSSRSPMTVVVADFRGINGEVTALGRYMAEEMITRLFTLAGARVIERGQLEKALDELKFSQTDLFDPDLAKKLGRFVGAEAILAGTITSLDNTIRINARLFNTERGEVLAAGTETIVRDEKVDRLLKIPVQPQSLSERGTRDDQVRPDVQDDSERLISSPPVFETDHLRVTVKSLRRTGSRLTIELWYENLTEQTMRLASSDWGRGYATGHRGTYLLSDIGEKWLFEDDTQVGNHYGGTELVSHRRLLNQITFSPEDRGNGSEVTYVGKYSIYWKNNPRENYRHEAAEVIIRNIRTGDYDSGYREETAVPPDSGYTPYVLDSPGDWSRGEGIFRKNCVVCHGERGDGRGPASKSLNPAPKDFRRSTISRGQIVEIIRSGVRGTSMVSFGKTLSEREIQDVGEYVYRFRN